MKKLFVINNLAKFRFVRFGISLLPIVIILFGISLIWQIFITYEILDDPSEKITAVIGSIGIMFGAVQLILSTIIRRREFYRQIRYNEYKRITDLIQSFVNTINDNMKLEPDLVILEKQVMNLYNELSATLYLSNVKLFPGIESEESGKGVRETAEEIVQEISKSRKSYQKLPAESQDQNPITALSELNIKMSWHNEMHRLLEKLVPHKYELFKYIEKFI